MATKFTETQDYKFGRMAEARIARWLKSRGNIILPIYEIEIESGKGPRVFTALQELVAPDLLVFGKERIYWAEVKRKAVFTWHRNSQRWTTRIDLRHWLDYLKVREVTGQELWLFFLHECEVPDLRDQNYGCPVKCPVGLFTNSVDYLMERENHRAEARGNGTGWGASGMVYWARESLKQFATIEEMRNF
jgi:hypothetical protein